MSIVNFEKNFFISKTPSAGSSNKALDDATAELVVASTKFIICRILLPVKAGLSVARMSRHFFPDSEIKAFPKSGSMFSLIV